MGELKNEPMKSKFELKWGAENNIRETQANTILGERGWRGKVFFDKVPGKRGGGRHKGRAMGKRSVGILPAQSTCRRRREGRGGGGGSRVKVLDQIGESPQFLRMATLGKSLVQNYRSKKIGPLNPGKKG